MYMYLAQRRTFYHYWLAVAAGAVFDPLVDFVVAILVAMIVTEDVLRKEAFQQMLVIVLPIYTHHVLEVVTDL